MKYFEKIGGDRLYLSPVNVEDNEIYIKWMNDKSVSENIGNYSRMISLVTKEDWIKKETLGYNFAIILRENNELIGNISLVDVHHVNQTATLIIFIGERENRNKGYGKEAIKLILDYGFNTLNLNNIMLKVYSFNRNAIRSYEKLGFRRIGSRRKAIYRDGKFYDKIYMDILKEEYNDVKDYIFTN